MVDYRPRRRRRQSRSIAIPKVLSFKNVTLWRNVTKVALIGFVASLIIVPLAFFWISRDLPTPGTLVESKFKDATRIYDRKGELLYSVYQDQNRTYVELDKIPEALRQGTIAIEDKDFYKNKGFSPIGYVRVAWNAIRGKGLAGASTISQQLVKNGLLSPERTPTRKLKELILSVQVNNRFSKDEILEMYLNNIPYGGTAIGVEAAAQTYFGKSVDELDLAESAFLSGLPQSPSVYSPFTGDDYYIGRTEAVLKRMVGDKYITKEESEKALAKIKNYEFSQKETSFKAPHFVLYVKKILAEQFGEAAVEGGGLQVTTSLDYEMQKDAEKIVKEEIEKLVKFKASNGAAIVTNPKTGEILSMVGSKDYYDDENEGNFNVVTQGKRQPGSSMKPFIYAAAFEKGYSPSTMLMDVKTEFATGNSGEDPYSPVNYDEKFRGPIQLRFALGNSLNIPAVKILAMTGIEDSMQLAHDMGINTWEPTSENMKNVGLSLVLGGREVYMSEEAVAYGVLANKGIKQDLISILKVTDSKGKKLFEFKERVGPQILSEEASFLVSHILLDNVARSDAFGSNSLLRIPGRTVAVKTGTTDEKRDNWTFGYTPSRVVGVWVGNNDNTPMNAAIASGVTGASPIWNKLMTLSLKGTDNEEFEVPENVTAIQVDPLGGGLPRDGQPTRTEYFVKGAEPTSTSSIYKSKDGKDYWVFAEKDPVSVDGRNRWQEGINAWIEQNHKGEERYNPPEELLREAGVQGVQTSAESSPTETPTPTPEEDDDE